MIKIILSSFTALLMFTVISGCKKEPASQPTTSTQPVIQKPLTPASRLGVSVGKTKITPDDNNKYCRAEAIAINNRIFAVFNKRNTHTFQLVELNEDLSLKTPVFNMFSDLLEDSFFRAVDIRLATDDESNLWYVFEGKGNLSRQQLCDKILSIAKYDISENTPVFLNSKLGVSTTGCPSDPRKFKRIPKNQIPENPEAVDDATPFFYSGKYIILTRAAVGTVQRIRTLDASFNLIEEFTLDLKSVIGDKMLSQNTLVNIDNQIYLIGGLHKGPPANPNSNSDIYAIPLSNDLHSVSGNKIALVADPNEYFTKVTSAKYVDGKLYINYVKAGNGQLQHLGVFDVENNFVSLVQVQFQDESVSYNHSSIEVLGNKVYALYQGDEDGIPVIFGKVFEWQEREIN